MVPVVVFVKGEIFLRASGKQNDRHRWLARSTREALFVDWRARVGLFTRYEWILDAGAYGGSLDVRD